MTRRLDRAAAAAFVLAGLLLPAVAGAGDWPMWRFDALRSACSPEAPSAMDTWQVYSTEPSAMGSTLSVDSTSARIPVPAGS